MTGHHRGAAVHVAVVWLAFLSVAAAVPADVEGTPAPEQSVNPAATESRIWIEPGQDEPSRYVSFHVRYKEQWNAAEPVVFECEIRSDEEILNGTARMEVVEATGAVLYEGEVALPVVPKGVSPCEFRWNAAGVGDGAYGVRFELLSRHDRRLMAARNIRALIISREKLQGDIESASEKAAAASEYMKTIGESNAQPAYPRMRLAVAQDSVEIARQAFEEGDWRRAHKIAQCILTTLESVRCQLSLGGVTPELMEPAPQRSLSNIEHRDGSFWAEGRPAFLVGGLVGDEGVRDIERLARYGLNLAVVSVPPAATLGEQGAEDALRQRLDALFKRAEELGVTVSVRLVPPSSGEWFVKQYPELQNSGYADAPFDLAHPAARGALERHYESIVPYLAEQRAVSSLCILEQPRFHMGGEEVRQGFATYVQGEYADRDAINRAWQARMRDLSEIDIWWDYEKPAYQYDLQTYNYELGTKFIAALDSYVARLAPKMPLFVEYADNVLESGESARGVDRETLTDFFEITGCSAAGSAQNSMLAMGYPQQTLHYALLHSFAMEKPVFNLENRFLLGNDRFTDYSYGYVHSLMWEGALNGLSATAMSILDHQDETMPDVREFPECIEAYAAGCLDLNRLGPIVAAFRQAPAEVAILWSLPSKIIDNGTEHLASLQTAFEGVSWFGYRVRFITERQCIQGQLSNVRILVVPETPAVSDRAFRAIAKFVDEDGVIIRVGNPMPYGPHREARQDMLTYTAHTILIQNAELATSFLHAMDAAFSLGALPSIPRPVNPYGFPLEAVKTLHVSQDGTEYLYVLNLRKEPTQVDLFGGPRSGRDLIHARDIRFPAVIEPLTPMLVRLDPGEAGKLPLLETADAEHTAPSVEVQPVVQETSKR